MKKTSKDSSTPTTRCSTARSAVSETTPTTRCSTARSAVSETTPTTPSNETACDADSKVSEFIDNVLAGSIVPSATLGHSLAEELGVPTDSKSPCSSCSDESCKGREAKFVRKEPPKLDKDGFPELSLLSQSPELYYDISDACVEFDYKSILTTCEKGCHKCCSARYCCMTLDEARWVYSAHTDLCNQLLPEFRRLHKLKGKELDGEKCPFLLHGECSIYSVRPIYCRTVVSIHPPEECTIEGPTNPSVDRLTRLWRSIIIAYASVRSDTFGFGRVSGMMLNQMCPEETEGAVIRVKTETLDVDDEPGTAH